MSDSGFVVFRSVGFSKVEELYVDYFTKNANIKHVGR